MATIAGDAPYQERSLFVRKATGLVRGWSVHDAFIYATFSINLITLGLYIFSFGPFIPKGSLLLAAVVGWNRGVSFWGEPKGIFTASVITAVLAAGFISIGMRGYAKLQKICFYGGVLGLLIIFGLLIF